MPQRLDPKMLKLRPEITIWRLGGRSYQWIAEKIGLDKPRTAGRERVAYYCRHWCLVPQTATAVKIGKATRGRPWAEWEDERLLRLYTSLREGGYRRLGLAMGRDYRSCQRRIAVLLHKAEKAKRFVVENA